MSERLKQVAREVFAEALAACTVSAAVAKQLAVEDHVLRVGERRYNLHQFPDVRVVAIGKAGATLFNAVRPLLDRASQVRSVVCAPFAPARLGAEDLYFAGGHPLPNAASLESARAAVELLRGATKETLALFLISGGASSMFEAPLSAEVTLDDLLELNRKLVGSGAPIAEINCVRKHFSAVKGGRLLRVAGAATCVSLLVSDVPIGKLDALGSGPTLPDPTSVADCLRAVEAYLGSRKSLPASLDRLIEAGLTETPKPGEATFARAQTLVLLDNSALLGAAQEAAERRGFRVVIDNSCDDWDYKEAAEHLLGRLQKLALDGDPVCLLSGGEITVRLPAHPGVGGRNLQWALYCASQLRHFPVPATVLSAGSDGIDGVSPAAGAVADGTTWARIRAMNMKPADRLAAFDGFPALQGAGDVIETGPTGNNLRDMRALLWAPSEV